MKFFQNASIKRKQVIIIMLTTSIALLLACIAFAAYEINRFRRDALEDTSTVAKIVANNIKSALGSGDHQTVQDTISFFVADTDISGISVYSMDGKVFAQYDPPDDGITFTPPAVSRQEGNLIRDSGVGAFAPIIFNGKALGMVYVESNLQGLYSRLENYATIALAIFIVTMVIAFLISAGLQRLITRPILELAGAAHQVARDEDYSIRVTRRGRDEIGTLIDGFNAMLAQIQERDANLERRVKERTDELAQSLSLLNATLESTADGIIASNLQGDILSLNSKFVALFGFPVDMIERRNPTEMKAYAARQMKDPDAFFRRYAGLYSRPEMTACDMELKDGRVFERYTFPQYINQTWMGVVLNWRDVTERRNAEKALRESQGLYSSLVEQLPINV